MRSGKNFIINLRFTELLSSWPPGAEDSDVYLGGKSKDTVERIFLRDLFTWLGEGNYTHNKAKGKGTFSLINPRTGRRFTREFFSFGYGDADSHVAISGATIGLAYLTEGIYCHEDFHRQLTARLSIDDGKGGHALLLGDTNPAGPQHWLWEKVINNQALLNAGDVRAFPFNFYSNPSATESYRDSLRRGFGEGSLWYRRMIDGEWCMAEGLIYTSSYDEARNRCTPEQLPRKFDKLWCAMDYGTVNAFILGLFGSHNGKTYLIDAYDHDGAANGQKTNAQYLHDITEFLAPYQRHYQQQIEQLIIDPSAASFKADLTDMGNTEWQRLGIVTVDADNDVEPGIKTMSGALHRGEFIICSRVERFFRELHLYAWDPKAQQRGIDAPLKKNDHCMDMCRYSLHTRKNNKDAFAAWL